MVSKVIPLTPISASAAEFGDHGVAAFSDSRAHHPPAIVAENVVSQSFGHGVPVAGREVRRMRS